MNSNMPNDGNSVAGVIGSLWEFDILAFHRFSDERHGTRQHPERNLMFVVLLNAVEDFQKYALLQDKYASRRFRETEEWILKNDLEWPFSFINICDALGIDARYLRKGLSHWKQTATQVVPTKNRIKRSA